MSRKLLPALLAGLLAVGFWVSAAGPAGAQPYTGTPPAAAPAPLPGPPPVPPPVPGVQGVPSTAGMPVPYHSLNRFWYYPYYYFPANYWPMTSPRWPEATGQCYQRPPAYMAFPAFKEPHWRYEYWEPQSWYRGSHFWLDIF